MLRGCRNPRHGPVAAWAALAIVLAAAPSVRAAPPENRPAQSAALAPDSDDRRPPSIESSLGAIGDPAGWRTMLAKHGISYNVLSTSEGLANISGGTRRDRIYAGKLEGAVSVDLDRLAGWTGWSAFVNAFQIHDTGGLRDRTFQRLITVSNIEARPSTRLSELWLERRWDDDRFSLRAGQLVADGEFFSSDTGKVFLSNDWPTITGANLPSGGPAYPLATPGLRFRYDPDGTLSALVAVFNGDPGNQYGANRSGTNFRLGDPPLVMAEVQIRTAADDDRHALASSLKLGAYRHFGRFEDQRFDTRGHLLASPSSTGLARGLRGTGGIYGVIDQQIFRANGDRRGDGVSLYARVAASPSDRSPIDLWMDGGLVAAGLVPGRPNDTFGISAIYARIGDSARRYDRDVALSPADFHPIRDYEATLELTYQAEIVPGWVIQPDLQYVASPGGGVADPGRAGKTIKGGLVFGLRSTVAY